jgi:hypothetical protein
MITFNQQEVFDVVKILRGNNNTNDNCTHLASDLIDYFKSGIKPTKESSIKSSTLNDFNVLITIDWIKKEDNNDYLGITQSTVCRDTSKISNIPYNIEYNKDNNDVYNLEQEIYNIDSYTQQTALVQNINDILKSEEPSFGFINLGRCGKYVENCGHMIVYFTTLDNVWYIDCQLYDGINKKDNGCIFNNLLDTYDFVNNKINIDTFSEYIFYIPIKLKEYLLYNIEIKKEQNIDQIINNEKIYCEHDKIKDSYKKCIGTNICIHNMKKQNCKECPPKLLCVHKKQRRNCKECGGKNICIHKKQKQICKECGGANICIHNMRKQDCKECSPKLFCVHKRRKRNCIECGGKNICIHKKQKRNCIECGGENICIHKKQKQNCIECGNKNICVHKKQKRNCIECGGENICIHEKQKQNCKECSPKLFCENKKQKQNCKECGGKNICIHKKRKYDCKECKNKIVLNLKKHKSIDETFNKEFDIIPQNKRLKINHS